MVNGVPTTNDLTEPETMIVSPIVYDDLSIVAVISGSVGVGGVDVSAKMGIDSAELRKNNIVKIGR